MSIGQFTFTCTFKVNSKLLVKIYTSFDVILLFAGLYIYLQSFYRSYKTQVINYQLADILLHSYTLLCCVVNKLFIKFFTISNIHEYVQIIFIYMYV